MEVNLFRFPNKAIRAQAIKEYMNKAGYKKAICFSCGNASKALKKIGVDVLDISRSGDLEALRWFTQAEIKAAFPQYFDATSGHLPMECLLMVAERFKTYLQKIPDHIYLPTGSGETLIELKLAFPNTEITAVYDIDKATRYEEACVLNGMIKILAKEIIFWNKES